MTILRNKRELEAVARDNQEGSPRNRQSRNSAVLRINEKPVTQVSEEIEGRVRKKLSQEFTRTEIRILGALSKLDEFLLNPQVWLQSGTVPEASQNINVGNQEPTGDHSQNDPRAEVDASVYQTAQPMDSDPKETLYTIKGGCCVSKLFYFNVFGFSGTIK